MASLFAKTERGREVRMLQVLVPGLGRKTVRLGQVPQRAAERFRDKVEALAACRRLNQSPDTDLVQWLEGLAEEVYAALAAAGLVQPRAPAARTPLLEVFLDKHISQKSGRIKPRSIELLEQTKDKLLADFPPTTLLDQVTPDQAADWRARLLDDGLSEATVRLHTRNAKAFFNDAVERELIDRNPFRKLPSAAVAAEHEHYVSVEDAEKVLAKLPDHEHRLLFGLARFGGLRIPSESHRLEWGGVDWKRRRLTVFAPKTGATRTVPVVPRLMSLLEEAYGKRERGIDQMLTITENNLHRTLHEAIEAAGLERWADLFQNLRRNAETDFTTRVPAHVAAAWLGHGVQVSRRFYLQVPDAMLDAVAGVEGGSALHLALQHGAEPARTGPQTPKAKKRRSAADAA